MKARRNKTERSKSVDPDLLRRNPEIAAILRQALAAGGRVRASSLLRRGHTGAGLADRFDGEVLASESIKLARLGLVELLRSRRGPIYIEVTPQGRRLVQRSRQRRSAAMVASAVAVIPVLASCVTASTTRPADSPRAPVVHRVVPYQPGLRQAELGVCPASGCPQPTPKHVLQHGPVAFMADRAIPPIHEEAGRDRIPVAVEVRRESLLESRAERSDSSGKNVGLVRHQAFSVFYRFGRSSADAAEHSEFASALPPAAIIHRVHLIGMTDLTGSATVNSALAAKRADHMRAMLARHGVSPQKITVGTDISARSDVPEQSHRRSIPSGNARYRRVDIELSVSGPDRSATAAARIVPRVAAGAADSGD